MTWPFTYAPGALVGFATGRLVALVDLPTDHDLVARIATVVAGGAPSFDALLDILVSRGRPAVDTFGLAEATGTGVRVLVRGACRAEGPADSASAEPGGAWVEATWPGPAVVRLVVPDADARVLPLAGGVVLASAIALGEALTELGVPPVPVDEPDPETEPALDPLATLVFPRTPLPGEPLVPVSPTLPEEPVPQGQA